MAGQIVTVYPDLPSFKQSLTLGGTRYRLRLTWKERLGAWYGDLYLISGVAVWLGQRVSSSWAMAFGLSAESDPEGMLYVRGPAEYRREDLGESLRLVFYADADLPTATVASSGVTVSV